MSDSTRTIRVLSVSSFHWVNIGGAPNVQTALSDDNDATYMRTNAAITDVSDVAIITMNPTSFLDTDIVKYLQPWVKLNLPNPGDAIDAVITMYDPLSDKQLPAQTIHASNPSLGRYNLQPFMSWPDGTLFTNDDFVGLILRLYGDGLGVTNTQDLHVLEVGIDIVYNAAPVITLLADPGDLGGPHPAQIRHSFTYSDAENDALERIQDRIYAESDVIVWPLGGGDAQIAALDAAGKTPMYSEEKITNLDQTSQVVMPPAGIFRRFVRAADEGSGQRFGSWSWVAFTMDTPASFRGWRPFIGVFPESSQARVRIEIASQATADDGISPGFRGEVPDSFEIQRSIDSGVTWQALPTSVETILKGTSPTVEYQPGTYTLFYDRFAPRETNIIYRVRSLTTGKDNNTLYEPDTHTSLWFQSGPVRLLSDGRSWLQAADDDNDGPLDLRFHHNDRALALSSTEQQSVFYAEGRAEPIVFSGTIHLDTGSLSLALKSESEWQALEALRELHGKMLLRTLFGEGPLIDKWVKLGSPFARTLVGGYKIIGNGQLRRVIVPFYEVDTP